VPNTCGHGEELAGVKRNLTVRELDDQLAVEAIEALVRVRMMMPRELVGHDAHPDFVIIDRSDPSVVIGLLDLSTDLQGI
jgi:hypothetical protein